MPGDLVIVFDPSLLRPNGQWLVRRITETYTGRDNVVKVTTVRTVSSIYTRPVVKHVYPFMKPFLMMRPLANLHFSTANRKAIGTETTTKVDSLSQFVKIVLETRRARC